MITSAAGSYGFYGGVATAGNTNQRVLPAADHASWSAEDDVLLERLRRTESVKALSIRFARKENAIRCRLKHLDDPGHKAYKRLREGGDAAAALGAKVQRTASSFSAPARTYPTEATRAHTPHTLTKVRREMPAWLEEAATSSGGEEYRACRLMGVDCLVHCILWIRSIRSRSKSHLLLHLNTCLLNI
jgi:hypothetical protein